MQIDGLTPEQTETFLEECKRSGLRETRCLKCGCYMLTRTASNYCPDHREAS